MNLTHPLTRLIAGTLLSGGVALAGMAVDSTSAHASPVPFGNLAESPMMLPAFNPQPEPPGRSAGTVNSHPESPGVRVGFDPQPEPPLRRISGANPVAGSSSMTQRHVKLGLGSSVGIGASWLSN